MKIQKNISIRYATVLSSIDKEKRKRENSLCMTCNGSGYKGRIGVYEYLPITRNIQVAIKEKKSDVEIQDIAVQEPVEEKGPVVSQ